MILLDRYLVALSIVCISRFAWGILLESTGLHNKNPEHISGLVSLSKDSCLHGRCIGFIFAFRYIAHAGTCLKYADRPMRRRAAARLG